jgi:hypothetical protein
MARWDPLSNQPTFNADTMLLLTDGSVMCHELLSPNWHRLVPDGFGFYLTGIWVATAPMPNPNAEDPYTIPSQQGGPAYAPLYFASAVLNDGRVFVAGGEYNGSKPQSVDLGVVTIYDPVADSWTYVAAPPWPFIGDAPCCVLPNGHVMLGDIFSTQVAIFNPDDGKWRKAGAKGSPSSEETWTLLPDNTVLAVNCANSPNSEKYIIAENKWISAGSLAPPIVQPCPPPSIPEIGPAILLPSISSTVFAIGANGNTAFYTPSADPTELNAFGGLWVPGPIMTTRTTGLRFAMDAPACLLPGGNVLCCGSPAPPCSYPGPTTFFEFDGVEFIPTPVPPTSNVSCFQCRMLLLPTGQVVLSNNSNDVEVYTPDGGPSPNWQPQITGLNSTVRQGHAEKLEGTQLNGLSQACSYGDDASMATNYPLVRIQLASGNIVFARTSKHSTMGVATGNAIEHTYFTIPAGVISPLETAPAQVFVVANGIASDPFTATVLYSVRTNLINDTQQAPEILPLRGQGLRSLINAASLAVQASNPVSVRELMFSLDTTLGAAPWWNVLG